MKTCAKSYFIELYNVNFIFVNRPLMIFTVTVLQNMQISSASNETTSKIIACESIKLSNNWKPLFGLKTCFMTKTTCINAYDTYFESLKNKNLTGLSFEGNKKILYLPVKLYESFRNLFGLDASDCSIKQISIENFRGLILLKQLWLRGNEIEIVASNTFESLKNLEHLSLGKLQHYSLIHQNRAHLDKCVFSFLCSA